MVNNGQDQVIISQTQKNPDLGLNLSALDRAIITDKYKGAVALGDSFTDTCDSNENGVTCDKNNTKT